MNNVRKGSKGDRVAVYDAKGRLVGTVDPTAITVLSDAGGLLPGDDKAGSSRPKLGAAPVEAESELQPAPSDAAGTPADAGRVAVAKSADGRRAQRDAAGTVAEREQVDRASGAAAASQLDLMIKARRALDEPKARTARRR